MSWSMDSPHEVRLLETLPDVRTWQGWRYSLRQYSLRTCPSYDVLEYLSVEDDGHYSSIIINDEPMVVQTTLVDALAHIVRQGESRKLWIESLCLEHQRASNPKERSGLIKKFRTNAETVIMWIGKDEEIDDILTEYLGPGSVSSTDAAFSICRSLAEIEDPQEDFRPLLSVQAEHSGRAKWCHLANLLYRPWFREMALLQTNYVEAIPSILVACGTGQVEWAHVKTAAERMQRLDPVPHLFKERFVDVFNCKSHIRSWLQARRKFEFHEIPLLAKALWLAMKISEEDDAAHTEQRNNLLAFVGVMGDLIEYDAYFVHLWIERESMREHRPQTLASLPHLRPLTTLPIQQPLRFPPDPELQAPYVGRHVRSQNILPLLKLFPHGGDAESLLQGSMISFSPEGPPPFLYVHNADLRNYRRNSLMLVDGHRFRVPEALEMMLRYVRDAKEAKLLFIWRMCICPQDPNVSEDRRGVSALVEYFEQAQNLVSISAGTIDMYEILMAAADDAANNPEGGLTGNDWLLDLLDEAQVNDLPPTKQSRKEDTDRVKMTSQDLLSGTLMRSRTAESGSDESSEEWIDESDNRDETDHNESAEQEPTALTKQTNPPGDVEKLLMNETRVAYLPQGGLFYALLNNHLNGPITHMHRYH